MEDSLQACPECGRPFNAKLPVCPHCGHNRGRILGSVDSPTAAIPESHGDDDSTSRYVGRRGRKKMSMFAGRMHDALRAGGVLILIALAVWFVIFRDQGPTRGRDEARQRFVDEIRQFDRFDDHEMLIMATIDEVHEDVFRDHRDNTRGSRGRIRYGPFIWDRYRLRMYQKVMSALGRDAFFNSEDDTIVRELEQFVARPP